jgi:uncharacterized protein (DUF1697 family)
MKSENRFIGLLRGINVSGQKPVKMNILQELLENLGLTSVKTYIQSGNIVFKSSRTAENLEVLISGAMKSSFGFDVNVMVFEFNLFKAILHKNPYQDQPGINPAFLHITLFSALPDLTNFYPVIDKKKQGEESYFAEGRCIYLYCPNGYGKTKLSNSFFEYLFKENATTRNWKTAQELIKMAQVLDQID